MTEMNDLETRTTAPEGPSGACSRCGQPIDGRRRNGFCSDACRMAVRRAAINQRRREALDALHKAVAAVEGVMAVADGLEDGSDDAV